MEPNIEFIKTEQPPIDKIFDFQRDNLTRNFWGSNAEYEPLMTPLEDLDTQKENTRFTTCQSSQRAHIFFIHPHSI